MRILLLNRYGNLGASSRLRFLQYLPYLEQQGMRVTASPLLDNRYLVRLYGEQTRSLHAIVAGYGRRLAALLAARRHDLLWIEKEIFPGLPAWPEEWLRSIGIPYVADYDDAVFHNYQRHANRGGANILPGKIDSVMRHATLVTAGNDYLAQYALRAGAQRVERLPTVVDLTRYPIGPAGPRDGFTVGWIGSPLTARYVHLVDAALASLRQRGEIRLVLVGADRGHSFPPGVPMEIRPWAEETEAADIMDFDVGIMPLPDGPWERGKCGYKLIQYMACGKPVVASPVGINKTIVEHGVNGFLAETRRDWVDALSRLRHDPLLRRRMGEAGRKKVEDCYSLQQNAPLLLRWLHEAAGR